MVPDHPAPLTVVVTMPEPKLVRSLMAGLERLQLGYHLASSDESLMTSEDPGVVYCLSAARAESLASLPRPALLVTSFSGSSRADEASPIAGVAFLGSDELTPVSLLRALILATLGTPSDFLARHLVQLEMFTRVPVKLVHAFLRDPSGMRRLQDVRRCLKLSRARAQALVRFTRHFERAEHLFTALRCATWAVLVHRGLTRPAVEDYLGMGDRAAFRRACHRAGVPTAHEGLSLMAFSK